MAHHIETFKIKELFSKDLYQIPIYQRNYAWGKPEISQLIQDIIDYIPENQKYYIGTLIVYERSNGTEIFYETIDGQQRLTTLSIILSVIKNDYNLVNNWFTRSILTFESRPLSQQGLDNAFHGYFDGNKLYHNTIKEAYEHIQSELKVKINEFNLKIDDFVSFLSDNVTILRVEVPSDTDLNHYFEIMNNRGEQLEKHEVLKSILLENLEDDNDSDNKFNKELLHLIWDGCSIMERYVQYGFEPKFRKTVFGNDWSDLQYSNYDDLLDVYKDYSYLKNTNKNVDVFEKNIEKILNDSFNFANNDNKDELPDRFTTPINFQNFLLHILRIQSKNVNYALDDKKLLIFFKQELKSKNKLDAKNFVKEFIFNLLRGKWILDSYVIKRQFSSNKEGWSLLKLKTNDGSKGYYHNSFGADDNWDNEKVLMLLSMFHVSTPTMIYKYWLNAALFYLFEKHEVNSEDYILYLEKIAKDLLCFRFLNEDVSTKIDYNTLIYNNDSLPEIYPKILYENKMLQYGSIENNLIFNLLDYIIWINNDNNIVNNFEFTFRSSVEHYYPQNPIGGKPIDDKEALHSFGNLCLISHQKNSKLNHHLPSAKKDYYAKLDNGGQLSYDSLKQYLMMNDYDAENWTKENIYDHHLKMINLFNDFIQNT